MQRGIQHSQQEGADLLGVMVPQAHSYYRLLRKRGFLPSLKTFQFLVYPHSKDDALLLQGWYVTWGDTDVI